MTSTRLTIAVKEKLTRQLLAHAFSQRSQKQIEDECFLAQEIYDDFLSSKTLRTLNGEGVSMTLRDLISWAPSSIDLNLVA